MKLAKKMESNTDYAKIINALNISALLVIKHLRIIIIGRLITTISNHVQFVKKMESNI